MFLRTCTSRRATTVCGRTGSRTRSDYARSRVMPRLPTASAEHTFPGFATGKFEGDILVAQTTHMKRGWIRANGVPQSDQAELVEWFIRHGDRLTHFSVVTD